MMTKLNVKRKLAIALFVAAGMLAPTSVVAQEQGGTDGFFGDWSNSEQRNTTPTVSGGSTNWTGFGSGLDFDNTTWGDPQNEDPTPLGEGLLILSVAGVAYAGMKKRNSKKSENR